MKENSSLVVFFCLISTIIGSLGCDHNDEYEKYFEAPLISEKDIMFSEIKLDSLILDKIESSYVGKFCFYFDSIYFVDQMFCNIFIFDKNGKFCSKNLGRGGGPNEVHSNEIVDFAKLSNDNYFILGPSFDCHIYDITWNRIKSFQIKRQNKYSINTIKTHPMPDMQQIYDIDYEKNMKTCDYRGHLFMPIESLMDRFHPVMKNYYTDSRIFFKIKADNGEIVDMLGRRSPVYLKYKFIGQFSWFNFDITEKGNFFICHEPDSLIYEYDKNMNNVRTFGFQGRDMNTNYVENISFEQTGMILQQEREEKGYYTELEYIDEMGLLFRSYYKGNHAAKSGLQIYDENCLIADIDVPLGFHVIGYSSPYFYSSGIIDEENEEIILYRFKLDFN